MLRFPEFSACSVEILRHAPRMCDLCRSLVPSVRAVCGNKVSAIAFEYAGWERPTDLSPASSCKMGSVHHLGRGWTMKPSRFTEQQIIGILREETGATTADVCR